MTKGKFGFHQGGGKPELSPAASYVQIYVKSSALSRTPDLAISAHLMTEAEIDEFCERCNHRVGRNPFKCQEGASRGGFTLGFPKDWVKPAEAGFVAIAREAECPLWVISGH